MVVPVDRPPHWLGLASELAVAPEGVETRPAVNCLAIHYPERRRFHDLNALWLADPSTPEPGDLPCLLRLWESEFGDTGVHARILCWEEAVEELDGSPWPVEGDFGDFGVSLLDVLRCDEPRPQPLAEGLDVRRVEGDADWQRLVELNLAVHGFESGPRADFCRWMLGVRHRAACEAGVAEWWAAWSGEDMVATGGLYRPPNAPARFQEIVTHPDHRNRGACTSLLSAILETGAERGFLLIAVHGSQAGRIYRRLGFREVSRIRELFQRLED